MQVVGLEWKKADFKAAEQELTTVRDFIRWAASVFNASNLTFGHGSDNSWDEATRLVYHVLRLSPDPEQSVLEAKLLTKEKEAILHLMQARVTTRQPLAYLTHEAWFSGLPFYVDERVLVPRSPVAELIEEDFQPWIEPHRVHQVLDLCTGSGSLAITMALAFPEAEVDAVDISEDALAVAAINVERYDLKDSVHLIHSDLFSDLKKKKYDLIVSNPPYVAEADYKDLPAEYTFEPVLALKSGHDGMDVLRRLLNEAADYLAPGGILVVEVGYLQSAVEQALPQYPFTWIQLENGGEGVFLLTAEELQESGK